MIFFFPNGIAGYDVASFRFTLKQTIRPFGAWVLSRKTAFKDIFEEGEPLPLILQLLATLQSIVSLTLLTLFILAVRRRFKL